MEVNYVIKNKVSEQDFEQIVYHWLAEGDYTPDDIVENIITENNSMFMPIHFYKCDYDGQFTGALGYPRTEYYYTWDNINKRQVQHSRVVTDWYPHTQAVRGSTTTLVYAGKIKVEPIISFIENMGWTGEELIQLSPNYEHYQALINHFTSSRSDSWTNKGYTKSFNLAWETTKNELPSKLVSNPTLNIQFEQQKLFSVLAPYWLFNYEYQGKTYYVMVDGNNPKRVDGIRPINEHRKSIVSAIRWIGWSVGLCTLITIFRLHDFDVDTFKNFSIAAIVVLLVLGLTYALTEGSISRIKKISQEKRLASLSNKLRRLNP